LGVIVVSAKCEIVSLVFKSCHVRAHLKAIINLRVLGTFGDHEDRKEGRIELRVSNEGLGIE